MAAFTLTDVHGGYLSGFESDAALHCSHSTLIKADDCLGSPAFPSVFARHQPVSPQAAWMDPIEQRTLARAALVAVSPLLLALLEVFHPHPHAENLLDVHASTWLLVHYAQILLFPLAALSVAALLRGITGLTAMVSRAALLVFAICFVAFDTAAGVATGILVQAAHASGDPEAWRPAIEAIWRHPIVGGVRQDHIPSLSMVGAAALSIATVAAAVSLKHVGRSWPPALLLGLSGFGLEVFNTHSWPGGPLTFGGIAVAAAWLEWQAARATAVNRAAIARAAALVTRPAMERRG